MRVIFFFTITLALMAIQSPSALAEGRGAAQIPHDLTALNQASVSKNFETLKGANGLVLVFIRSAAWCPYCQKQLVELNAAHEAIRDTGYNVAAISYDTVDVLKAFHSKHSLSYEMLSDKNSSIIRAFGILNQEQKPGSRGYGIPYPAIYILSSDGTIQEKLEEEGYKSRPAPEEIINAIRQVNSGD